LRRPAKWASAEFSHAIERQAEFAGGGKFLPCDPAIPSIFHQRPDGKKRGKPRKICISAAQRTVNTNQRMRVRAKKKAAPEGAAAKK